MMAKASISKWLTIVACILMPSWTQATPRTVPAATEADVKAAFLFNFARFVDWPETSFASPASAIVIGVVGDPSFADQLERIVKGEKISGRNIVVKRIELAADLRTCHIAFIPSSDRGRVSEILNVVRNTGVLTVGEYEDFARQGGVIGLYIQDGRVRFAINPDAAARSGLRIGSGLLALAKIVKDASAEVKR